jgi:hypothetical protein
VRPKGKPGRASSWSASLPRHPGGSRETVGLRSKLQVNREGLERNQLQEGAKDKSRNDPLLCGWRR